MRVQFKITCTQLKAMRADLERPHEFAYERVGFLFCRFGSLVRGGVVVLALDYVPVSDDDYIPGSGLAAMIGPGAFRKALQRVLTDTVGAFHVHMHPHDGIPWPSGIDRSETAKFVPDFFNVRENVPHGAIILSNDRLSGRIWPGVDRKPISITEVKFIGAPLLSFGGK